MSIERRQKYHIYAWYGSLEEVVEFWSIIRSCLPCETVYLFCKPEFVEILNGLCRDTTVKSLLEIDDTNSEQDNTFIIDSKNQTTPLSSLIAQRGLLPTSLLIDWDLKKESNNFFEPVDVSRSIAGNRTNFNEKSTLLVCVTHLGFSKLELQQYLKDLEERFSKIYVIGKSDLPEVLGDTLQVIRVEKVKDFLQTKEFDSLDYVWGDDSFLMNILLSFKKPSLVVNGATKPNINWLKTMPFDWVTYTNCKENLIDGPHQVSVESFFNWFNTLEQFGIVLGSDKICEESETFWSLRNNGNLIGHVTSNKGLDLEIKSNLFFWSLLERGSEIDINIGEVNSLSMNRYLIRKDALKEIRHLIGHVVHQHDFRSALRALKECQNLFEKISPNMSVLAEWLMLEEASHQENKAHLLFCAQQVLLGLQLEIEISESITEIGAGCLSQTSA